MSSRHDHPSFMEDTLRVITRLVSRNPKISLWFMLITAGIAVAITVLSIEFKTNRSDLIDPEAEFHQRWLQYTKNFGSEAEIIVVLESESSQELKNAIESLGKKLEQEQNYFSKVLYKIDSELLQKKGLQFLSRSELHNARTRLTLYGPVIRGRWELMEMGSLLERLRYQIESSRGTLLNTDGRLLIQQTELIANSLDRFAANRDDFQSPWPQLVSSESAENAARYQSPYLLDESGTIGFIKLLPQSAADGFEGHSAAIKRLREIVSQSDAETPAVEISITGIPVLETDEMSRSQQDMLMASLISISAVGLLLMIGFRGFRHPILAIVMLSIGMAWSFGYTTLAVGHLNILSVSFAAILIGLGIDFAIHYIARYLQLRHEGHQLRTALMETSGSVGTGIVTAAVTTALAFFCATMTHFLGVAELGIIAGGGIILCALATFFVLPALIALADRTVEPRKLPTPFQGNLLRSFVARYPVLAVLFSSGLVIWLGMCAFQLHNGKIVPRIHYDYNLLNLQADDVESVAVQRRIFKKTKGSLLYAVSLAESPEQARRLSKQFEQLPSVSHVEELATRIPAPQPENNPIIEAINRQLDQLPAKVPQIKTPNPAAVGKELEQIYVLLRDQNSDNAQQATESIDHFLNTFEQMELGQQMLFLTEYQARMLSAFHRQLTMIAQATDTDPISLADYPQALTSRFVSQSGGWLLQIYPKKQVWDIEPLTAFVEEVRSVDPSATGTPLQNYEACRQIKTSYEKAALYALAVICLVLLIDFLGREHKFLTLLPPLIIVAFMALTLETRRESVTMVFLIGTYLAMVAAIAVVIDFRNLRDTLLAIVPPITGGVMMFGILALTNVNLNPANLIVLPLVLGIGVDDGVHVVHDFRLQRTGYRMSPSTMNAIVLTSLTSMIGFGSMMVASHRGLYSVGLVLVVGVGCCLFVSLVLLPGLLTLMSGRNEPQVSAAETKSNLVIDQAHQKKTVKSTQPKRRRAGVIP